MSIHDWDSEGDIRDILECPHGNGVLRCLPERLKQCTRTYTSDWRADHLVQLYFAIFLYAVVVLEGPTHMIVVVGLMCQ